MRAVCSAAQHCGAEILVILRERRKLKASKLPLHKELVHRAVQLLHHYSAASEFELAQWCNVFGADILTEEHFFGQKTNGRPCCATAHRGP
mmetsp:Transcript_61808/g.166738  ORF Transcript_61808/g.166738 Transcript_61808/m.166738 type:complete len:91 (+) Transcript_61808:345-617(+)